MAGSHGNVLLMTSRQQFDNAILECTTNGKLMLIDFTASWCGPCKMIAPLFAELSEKYAQIHFAKVDVDDLQEVAAEYEVRAMPTFVMVKEGKEVARVVGMEPVGLELMIKSSLTDLDHAAA